MGIPQKTVVADSLTLKFSGTNVTFPSVISTQVILDKSGGFKSVAWLECNQAHGWFRLTVFFEESFSVQAKDKWILLIAKLEAAFPAFKMQPRFVAKGSLPINAELIITRDVFNANEEYEKLVKILSKY